MSTSPAPWIVYGSELSPFTLKVLLLCQHANLPHRFLPTDGSTLDNIRIQWRLRRLQQGRIPLTWPPMTDEDEFPLVPYLFGPDGENLYDSTAIAEWLDDQRPTNGPAVIPAEPAAAFIARLIDDYADEFGLYMVHHYRWTVSARSNNAGRRLAREWRRLLGPLQTPFAAWFSARQVQRLPYLFSTATPDHHVAGLPRRRQPPARAGFAPTHALLEAAYLRLLDALEHLLQQRPYLLGGRFTLADAAIYGQLAMNLDDPDAAAIIQGRAPGVFRWLHDLRSGHSPTDHGELALDQALAPLLREIGRTHVPLMQQNFSACEAWLQAGETLFNEAAFNRGRALYEGHIEGQPFRHVAKRFQAKTWRQCLQRWQALSAQDRERIGGWLSLTADLADHPAVPLVHEAIGVTGRR